MDTMTYFFPCQKLLLMAMFISATESMDAHTLSIKNKIFSDLADFRKLRRLLEKSRIDLWMDEMVRQRKPFNITVNNQIVRDRIGNTSEANLWTVGHYIAAHKYYGYDVRYVFGDVFDEDREFNRRFGQLKLRDFHPDVKRACETTVLACIEEIKNKALKSGSLEFLFNSTRDFKEPFDTEYEVFRYRQTAAYYMCWFTLMEEPYMMYTNKEPCFSSLHKVSDRRVHKFNQVDEERVNYQYYKNRPFVCSQLWFCPDPCFGRETMGNVTSDVLKNPGKDRGNPCRHLPNSWCSWMPQASDSLADLIANRHNTSCDCASNRLGYSWNPVYQMCVDTDECYTGEYNCGTDFQCRNTIGAYECDCRRGYNLMGARCVPSPVLAFKGKFLKVEAPDYIDPLENEAMSILDSIFNALGAASFPRSSMILILMMSTCSTVCTTFMPWINKT